MMALCLRYARNTQVAEEILQDGFLQMYRNIGQTIDIAQVSAYSTRKTDTRRIRIVSSYHFGKSANARKVLRNSGGAGDQESRTR